MLLGFQILSRRLQVGPPKVTVLPLSFPAFSTGWSRRQLRDFTIWHGKFKTNLISPCNSLTWLPTYFRNIFEAKVIALRRWNKSTLQTVINTHSYSSWLYLHSGVPLFSWRRRAIFHMPGESLSNRKEYFPKCSKDMAWGGHSNTQWMKEWMNGGRGELSGRAQA